MIADDIIDEVYNILRRLPEPRLQSLKVCALSAAEINTPSQNAAARFLGVTPRAFCKKGPLREWAAACEAMKKKKEEMVRRGALWEKNK